MLILKTDNYYKKFIGRYFRMDISNLYSVDKILDYKDGWFYVEHCALFLGGGLIEYIKRRCIYVDRDNFHEISRQEYNLIKYQIF